MGYDFVTDIHTRPGVGEHILVGGRDAEASCGTAGVDANQEGVSLGESPERPGGHPDLPTFRPARFAEGKPIRGTYGDRLMC